MARNQIAWAAIAAAVIALPALAQPAISQPGTNTDTGALPTNRAGPSSDNTRQAQTIPASPVIGANTAPGYRSPSASGAIATGTTPNQYLGMQAGRPYTPMLPGSVAGEAPGMGSTGARVR